MSFRIDKIELKNYGVLDSFVCDRFSNINVLIGENGTGKTILLKAMYSAIRSMEEYNRGDAVRTINDILSDKLRWTFKTDRIGDLVNSSSGANLSFQICSDEIELAYAFSKSASTRVGTINYNWDKKEGNSIFIPAKEVLSLFSVILKSREIDRVFGFDDTYYDLVKALRIAPSRGKNFTVFSSSRKTVNNLIDGKVDYD